jgi:alginate O-acetyltransferase complex protein AlgI
VVFNSLHFVWFFVAVYAFYRVLPAVTTVERAHRGQNWLLLIASYYFYAAWDYRFLALLAASTLVDYACGIVLGKLTDQRRRRVVLWLSIGFNLTMLGFFKYFNFFADNLHALFMALGWQLDFVTLRVLLPIGISFYTFVTMSYVIDVYRREIEPTRHLVDFAVFVAYFPHLVAGPILRATALLPQIARPRIVTRAQVREGLWLIAWGFFQKIFVADNLAPLASRVFAPDAHPAGVNVLLGTYAFAFQIYGDFAGYSNIARGTSKLMGIELIENFRFPYLVLTPQAFWRHWHISLSTWLRDYLYKPLGGSRGTAWQTRRNLMITMLLGGLWHGAAWTFILWGLYQAVLLILYRPFEPAFAALKGDRSFGAARPSAALNAGHSFGAARPSAALNGGHSFGAARPSAALKGDRSFGAARPSAALNGGHSFGAARPSAALNGGHSFGAARPSAALNGGRSFGAARRFAAWLLMFHLTGYGWLIFRAPSLDKLRELTYQLFFRFSPAAVDITGLLVPLLLYTTPLLVVHLLEARADDVLVVPRMRVEVRYAIYVATLYLIMLFGNFGGSDFIYFQF